MVQIRQKRSGYVCKSRGQAHTGRSPHLPPASSLAPLFISVVTTRGSCVNLRGKACSEKQQASKFVSRVRRPKQCIRKKTVISVQYIFQCIVHALLARYIGV